jgi:protein involved in polysaccharide export with SLBB domain
MLIEHPIFLKSLRYLSLGTTFVLLVGCGVVYTPQNLPLQGSKTLKNQAKVELTFITIDQSAVTKANRTEYKRRVIDGSNLNGPARLQPVSAALSSNWPVRAKPQPYLIGIGDTLTLTRIMDSSKSNALTTQELRVSESGHVTLLDVGREKLQELLPSERGPFPYLIGVGDVLNYATIITSIDEAGATTQKIQSQSLLVSATGDVSILGVGEVSVSGLRLGEARNEVSQLLLRRGLAIDFQLAIIDFKSQEFVVGGQYVKNGLYPYTTVPVSLNTLLTGASETLSLATAESLNITVRLIRGEQQYRFTAKRLLTGTAQFYVYSGDRIIVETAGLNSGIDPISVVGVTADQARLLIERELKANQLTARTNLGVTDFRSQKYFVSGDVLTGGAYPFTDTPILLVEAMTVAGLRVDSDADSVVSFADRDKVIHLFRAGHNYRFSARDLLSNPAGLYVQAGDRLVVEDLSYRSEKVIIAGAVKLQTIYPITAEGRQTLSDALYSTGALSTSDGDPSQIYVLRQMDKIYAYHLDGSNPATLILAGKFELRPNDIIFIAEQPINEFNRVLQDVLRGIGGVSSLLKIQ